VVEGAGLENRYTGNGIVGSNPTLSASIKRFFSYFNGLGFPDVIQTTFLPTPLRPLLFLVRIWA
jgi:hypothetical protein